MANTQHKHYVVDDGKGAKPGDIIPIIASFDTEQEAAEFISTLPEFETGRYGITGPAE